MKKRAYDMDPEVAKKVVAVGKHLAFDAQALATSVTALLGIRGSGKSTTAGVIAEGLMDADIPVVIIDQVGPWFGLRLQPDGKTPSRFKIPVLGGAHGDITLSPQAGRQVAEALATSRSSAILDISMMRKGERIRFCADFAEAFLDAKKRAPGAVSLILEEAQDVVPQMMRFASPDMARCLGAFEDVANVGRNFGIGLVLLSLRPQKLSKEVLNLAETVVGVRMLGVLERKAIAEWVQEKGAGDRAEVAGELPSLKRGTAIVWSPSVFGVYGVHALAPKTTYDASSTPGADRAAVTTKPLDIAALESTMSQVVAEAKANDPRALKARIAELERAKPAPAAEKPAKVIEKQVIGEPALKRIEAVARQFEASLIKIDERLNPVRDELRQVFELLKVAPRYPGPDPAAPGIASIREISRDVTVANGHTARAVSAKASGQDANGSLSRAGRAILGVLASRGVASDSVISALSGYRRTSSTFATALSELRTAGLIDGGIGQRKITADGRDHANKVGLDASPPPSGKELIPYWLSRLDRCEGAMLSKIAAAGTISRAHLSEATGYSITSSTFANGLSGLRTLDLIHGPTGGDVSIADVFTE